MRLFFGQPPSFLPRLMVGILALAGGLARADEPVLPGAGWSAPRYEALWSKSPFAVATPDAAPDSVSYTLWGIAKIEGVSYASVTDKQNSHHYLLATNQPVQGLTLVSITRGKDASDTTAVVQKDGQTMTLKMEQGPASGGPTGMPNGPGPQNMFMPGNRPPMPLPGHPPSFFNNRFPNPPQPSMRPPTIHPPPPPPQ